MIKKHLPKVILRLIPVFLKKWGTKQFPRLKWIGSHRVVCISLQKTGTTSVGDFFIHFGFPTARWIHSWQNQWTRKWFEGDFESIFSSKEFKRRQVFEDDPWWCPEFYKVLYHRFPKAKFVLFYRDSEQWFQSMMKHHGGKNLGNARQHCKMYRREKEFYDRLENDPQFAPSPYEVELLMDMEPHKQHYTDLYKVRQKEVLEFFDQKDNSRLISLQLEDPDKWVKLGKFMGLKVPKDLDIHSNASKT